MDDNTALDHGVSIKPETRSGACHAESDSMIPQLCLTPVSGQSALFNAPLAPGKNLIGTSEDCEITFPVNGIASRHCAIEVQQDEVTIDAISPMTWLNKEVVQHASMKIGDRLSIGPVVLQLEKVSTEISEEQNYLSEMSLPSESTDHRQSPQEFFSDDDQTPEQRLTELLDAAQHSLEKLSDHQSQSETDDTTRYSSLQQKIHELEKQCALLGGNQSPITHTPVVITDDVLSQRWHELKKWEDSLLERQDELAARAESLVAEHRRMKDRAQLLVRRDEILDRKAAEQRHHEGVLRNQRARNQAQCRQLTVLNSEAELREDFLKAQLAHVNDKQKIYNSKKRKFEAEKKQWISKLQQKELQLEETQKAQSLLIEQLHEQQLQLAQRQSEQDSQKEQFHDLQARLLTARDEHESLMAQIREREIQLREGCPLHQPQQDSELQQILPVSVRDYQIQLDQKAIELRALEQELTDRERAVSEEMATLVEHRAELNQRQTQLETLQEEFERERAEAYKYVTAHSAEHHEQLNILIHDLLNNPENSTARAIEILISERTKIDLQRRQLQLVRAELDAQETQLVAEQHRLRRLRKELTEDAQPRHQGQRPNSSSFEMDRLPFSSISDHLYKRLGSIEQEFSSPKTDYTDDEDVSDFPSSSEYSASLMDADHPSSGSHFTLNESLFNPLTAKHADFQSLYKSSSTDDTQPIGQSKSTAEYGLRQEQSKQPDSQSSNEDPSVVQLRSELASLFGFDPAAKATQIFEKPHVEEETAAPSEPVLQRHHEPVEMEHRVPEVTSTHENQQDIRQQSDSPNDLSEEISVSSYMQELLARNRPKSHREQAPVVTPAPEPIPVIEEPVHPVEDVEPSPTILKKTRKLNAEELQSLKANLHSFREVANQSARTAVAKSHADQKASSLRFLFAGSGIGWLLTALVLSIEVWMGRSQIGPAIGLAAISCIMSILAIWRYQELKRITPENDYLSGEHAVLASHEEEDAPKTH